MGMEHTLLLVNTDDGTSNEKYLSQPEYAPAAEETSKWIRSNIGSNSILIHGFCFLIKYCYSLIWLSDVFVPSYFNFN